MSDKAPKDQEQKVAEAEVEEFKKDLGPFVVAAESTRMPMVFTDAGKPDNPIIFANDAYGAFSNESGTISIKWTLESESDGRWLCLHWRENDGPQVTPPLRKGFGSRVLEQGLAHELNGKVDLNYAPGGFICTIHVPVPQAALDG